MDGSGCVSPVSVFRAARGHDPCVCFVLEQIRSCQGAGSSRSGFSSSSNNYEHTVEPAVHPFLCPVYIECPPVVAAAVAACAPSSQAHALNYIIAGQV